MNATQQSPEDVTATPDSRISELKDLERRRGELLREPRTTTRDLALDALSRLQRSIVEAMSYARRNG